MSPRTFRGLSTTHAVLGVFLASFLFGIGNLHADVVSFTNATSVTIRDNNSASPYPSAITVSGVTGLLSKVIVRLNNLSHGLASDIDALLVGPTGAKFIIFSDVGGFNSLSGVNVTLDDAAGSTLPPTTTIVSGTYKPTDAGGVADSFFSPAPVPAFPGDSPLPSGSATLASQFNGTDPNGAWNLYIVDDSQNTLGGTLLGGWALTLTTVVVAPTVTTVQSSLNPSFALAPSNTVIFTATVTSSNLPVTQGTVTFKEGAATLSANVPLNGSGQCHYTNSALTEGSHLITAAYNGAAAFGISSGSVTQAVDNHTVVTGNSFANPGTITIPDNAPGTVYPSRIFVSGWTGGIARLSLVLTNLGSPRTSDLDMLLESPGGATLLFFSGVGGPNSISGATVTLADTAGSLLPGSAFTSGTYRPTDLALGIPFFPPPAPALVSSDLAAPAGTGTFGSVFDGSNPNGTWSLYVQDRAANSGGSSSLAGWSLTFVPLPRPFLTNGPLTALEQFQFGFTGVTATAYTVLASSNLVNWSVLGTATEAVPGVYRFADPQPATNSGRFYRVRVP